MNKIEQEHLESFNGSIKVSFRDFNPKMFEGTDLAAQKSALITKRIAIEFGIFLYDYRSNVDKWEWIHPEQLFEEFLKTLNKE